MKKILIYLTLLFSIFIATTTVNADDKWLHPFKLDEWKPIEDGQQYGTTGYPRGRGYFHNGWDFGSAKHSGDFYAMTGGTVTYKGYYSGGLQYVIVVKSGKYNTIYQEFGSTMYVNVGDTVKKGDKLGTLGSSHLHVSVATKELGESQASWDVDDGTWVNPKALVTGELTVDAGSNSESSSDDKKEETGDNESKYVGDDAWKNRMINFKQNTYENTFQGLETGSTGFVSNAVIMNMNKSSQKVLEWSYIIMFSASIALFFFMFVTTIIYLVILPNGLGGMKLMNAFEKTTGLSPTVNKNTTMDLLGRLGITVFLIACIYANLIPLLIANIIQIFQLIVSFFV